MAGSTKTPAQQPTSFFAPGQVLARWAFPPSGMVMLCYGEEKRGGQGPQLSSPILSLKYEIGSESGAIACAVRRRRRCIAVVKTSSWILDLRTYKFLCGTRGREGREVRLRVKREGGRKASFCARFYPAAADRPRYTQSARSLALRVFLNRLSALCTGFFPPFFVLSQCFPVSPHCLSLRSAALPGYVLSLKQHNIITVIPFLRDTV